MVLPAGPRPDDFPNAWLMEIHPGERFVYCVRRLVTERLCHVVFDLASPVEPFPAPPVAGEGEGGL